MRKKRHIRLSRELLLLFCAGSVLPTAGQEPLDAPRRSVFSSVRPLFGFVFYMQDLYAVPVSYEEPIWKFSGDVSPMFSKGALYPTQRCFPLPPGLTPTDTPKLDASVLG